MNKALVFSIAKFMTSGTGYSERYTFEGPVNFDDIKVTSDIKGQAEIMKTEDGLNVKVENVKVEAQFICDKCLEPFVHEVHIQSAEREFLFKTPRKVEDVNDIFVVDLKHLKLEISELIRQEMILHFPVVPVCSTKCKGLCPYCGKNRNKQKCDCKEEVVVPSSPLSVLKDLLK